MDVERTMQFILEQQAAAVWSAKTDELLDAIAKMAQIGMKALVRTGQTPSELAAAQKELVVAQKQTEASLKGLIDNLRRGTNGHSR